MMTQVNFDSIGGGGGAQVYYETIPSGQGTSSSDQYTVNCGFKAHYIYAVARQVGSNVLASGCVYNPDDGSMTSSQYRNLCNQGDVILSIGDTSQTRGLNIGDLQNTYFTIWGTHSSSPIYVIAVSE